MAKMKPLLPLLSLVLAAAPLCPAKDDLARSHVGVAVVNSKYHFTKAPLIVEGGEEIQKLGSKAIKVWLTPDDHNLLKLAQSEAYTKLFDMPFEVYALEALRFSYVDFRKLADADLKEEEEAFYQLTKYLLEKYQGTGKTFILQNWESDYYLHSSLDLSGDVSTETFDKVAKWFNARQAGVERARKEKIYKDVNVYHAAEANHVISNMEGQPCVVNNVFPKTQCDLYSYSCYETQYDPRALIAALRYLKTKAPDSVAFGNNNIMLGEFGWAENISKAEEICKRMEDVVVAAVREKIPYAFYWQLYCNEWAKGEVPYPKNEDMKGFWLIRADQSVTPMYEKLKSLMEEPYRDGPKFKYAYERDGDKGIKPPVSHKVPALAQKPVLDGDLAEWKEKAASVPIADPQRVFEIPNWNTANCSGAVFLACTKDGLAVGIEVTDDQHYQADTKATIWKGDSVQITVDGDNDKNPFYDANDQELGFAMSTDGKSQEFWRWHGGKPVAGEYEFKIVRKDKTTVYEIWIPYTALKASKAVEPGSQIGFNVIINDDDGKGRGWIEMEDGIARTKDPSRYPILILAR